MLPAGGGAADVAATTSRSPAAAAPAPGTRVIQNDTVSFVAGKSVIARFVARSGGSPSAASAW